MSSAEFPETVPDAPSPAKPGWVAAVFLLFLLVAVTTTLRMSWLAFRESWDGAFDPALAEVPGGQPAMFLRAMVHGGLLGVGLAVAAGAIFRKRWGLRLAQSLIPARFAGLLVLVLLGNMMGLNLFLRLEFSIASVNTLLALVVVPLSFWSRQVKAFYRFDRDPESLQASGDRTEWGASDRNPYRRSNSDS